jgi:hypothetical protein
MEHVGGIAIGSMAVLGYGIGVGIGPAGDGIGVKHTSGMANCMPPKEQLANIIFLLSII